MVIMFFPRGALGIFHVLFEYIGVTGMKSRSCVIVSFTNRPWASWRKLLHVQVTLSPPATPAASCPVCCRLVWLTRRPPASLRYTKKASFSFKFTKSSVSSLDLVMGTYITDILIGGATGRHLIHRCRDQLLGTDYWLHQAVDCRRWDVFYGTDPP